MQRVLVEMSKRFSGKVALLFLGLSMAAVRGQAQDNKLATWWPDLQQNIVWTGQPIGGGASKSRGNYEKAVGACKTLSLDGMSGWRLPTIDELDHNLRTIYTEDKMPDNRGHLHDAGTESPMTIVAFHGDPWLLWFWSSTPGPDGTILTERKAGGHAESKPTDHRSHGELCVRPLDPDIAEVARQVRPRRPVSDLTALRNLVPLRQANEAYRQKDYAASLKYARTAVKLNPKLAEAFYGQGLSQARLGMWTEAIASLKTAKKLNWNWMGDSLQWASLSAKAAASGTVVDLRKTREPAWDFDQ